LWDFSCSKVWGTSATKRWWSFGAKAPTRNISAEKGKCAGDCHAIRASWLIVAKASAQTERIFASTIDLHSKKAKEREVTVDTIVQEKNIAFPTDTKLAAKIVRGGVKLRQSFERTVPKLLAAQLKRRTKSGAVAARKAARRLKTIFQPCLQTQLWCKKYHRMAVVY
jgi:hypothetical protein